MCAPVLGLLSLAAVNRRSILILRPSRLGPVGALVRLDMAASGIVVGLVVPVVLVVVSEVTVSVAVLVGIPGAVETNMRAAGGAVVGAAHEAGNRLRVADLPACVPEGTRALADGVLPAVVGALG